MKKFYYILLGCLLIFGTICRGQSDIDPAMFEKHAYSHDWQNLFENETISVQYKYSDCSDDFNGIFQENLILKVTNLSSAKIYVLWDYLLEYSDGRVIAPDEGSVENAVQLTLNANESAEGSCSAVNENRLNVFVQMKDDANSVCLSSISLENLETFQID